MDLVVGATGNLGSAIAYHLVEQGNPVRVLVRPGSDVAALERAGAEIVRGDLTDPATLPPALDGVERLLTTATGSARGGHEAIEAVDLHGTASLIDAAREAGIEQFVYVSAHGFEEDGSHPLARAKASNERRLRESGMGYTVLRPGAFMEVWIGLVLGMQLQTGPEVIVVGDPDAQVDFVAMEDVRDLAVAVLGHPKARNSVLPLAGGSRSYGEVVSLIGEAGGQEIEISALPPGEPVPQMPPIVSELWPLLLDAGRDGLDTADVARTFGLQPTTVEAFVQRSFGAAPSGG